MSYPDYYSWDFPGMYSLSLHYGNANTFFFASLVGFCMINYLEFRDTNHTKLAYA
jgi:hypothetical protein